MESIEYSNIYALETVTDRINLTPVAIAEAQAFAETVFNESKNMDYSDIPCAVFSQPISSVGLSEDEARNKFGEIDVYISGFRPMNTMTKIRTCLQKLIVDRKSQRVVGAHMIGDVFEILQGIVIAIKAKATKADLIHDWNTPKPKNLLR